METKYTSFVVRYRSIVEAIISVAFVFEIIKMYAVLDWFVAATSRQQADWSYFVVVEFYDLALYEDLLALQLSIKKS